jgi:predicted HD phosphohydrolase
MDVAVLADDPWFDVDDVIEILANLRGNPYEDEGVDQLDHVLQTAQYARTTNADSGLVAAALLHDIGRAPEVVQAYGAGPHEEVGARFVRRHCGDRVAHLVGAHVPAKRYLVATDGQYAVSLSAASQRSLERQGGPMSSDEVSDFESQPWSGEAALLRRWDDKAKVQGVPTATLDSYKPVLVQVWLPEHADAER